MKMPVPHTIILIEKNNSLFGIIMTEMILVVTEDHMHIINENMLEDTAEDGILTMTKV